MAMIKDFIRAALQTLLGFPNYLFLFSIWNHNRLRMGGYEKDFLFFTSMLPNKGAILDIGANIGVMTVWMAKKCPAATVYAFEPVPENMRVLQKILHYYRLGNVRVFGHALGNTNGMVQMVMPFAGRSKMQGLSHVIASGAVTPQGEIFEVPVHCLDDLPVLQEALKISAVKMDVENFEYFVLKGGETLLKKHRPMVYCELWNDDRRALCIDLMKGLGYRVAVYRNGKLVDFDGAQTVNFFFLPV